MSPLERFPDTYNKQPLTLAGLASRKNNMTLYLSNVYGNPKTERWFKNRWAETGKKLNMGKSCVYFKRLRISRSTSSLRSSRASHSTNSSLTTRRFGDRRESPGCAEETGTNDGDSVHDKLVMAPKDLEPT
jgi:hypothetical protein